MPSSSGSPRVPKYRRHKTGQAFVRIRSRNHYLGKYGTEASKEAYRRIIAEHLARQCKPPSTDAPVAPVGNSTLPSDLSINEVALRYLRYAETYYQKNGEPTPTLYVVKAGIRRLRSLYGHTSANEFGGRRMKAIRESLVREELAVKTINDYLGVIRRIFKWAVSEDLLAPGVYETLRTVANVRAGRPTESGGMARVTKKVVPVLLDVVEKTLPHLSPQCRAMVRLQLASGMRPGEVVMLRPCDVDTTAEPWEYVPRTHKTEHHGKSRGILLGPQAREILTPWMDRAPASSCFSPAEAEQARNAERRRQARSPRRSTKRSARPNRPPAGEYTTDSYRRAIVRACEIAFEMPKELRVISKKLSEKERKLLRVEASQWRAKHCWTPHRLRHTFGTTVRSLFGIEAAQITLGVADLETAAIYSERDKKIASQIVQQVG